MRIEGDIDKIEKLGVNLGKAMSQLIVDAALNTQNEAKENAPYDTGTLRKSISHVIRDNLTGFVGSDVVYSRVREYINNLHPDRREYLGRAVKDTKEKLGDMRKRLLDRYL